MDWTLLSVTLGDVFSKLELSYLKFGVGSRITLQVVPQLSASPPCPQAQPSHQDVAKAPSVDAFICDHFSVGHLAVYAISLPLHIP